MNRDPRDVIAASRMSALQLLVIAITIGLNALDGFDVLSISYASPGIATEWADVDRLSARRGRRRHRRGAPAAALLLAIRFYFGAALTTFMIPIVFAVVPESIPWLARKQPAGALERINRALARMGRDRVPALPALTADARRTSIADIFAPGMRARTIIVTLAYFFHITTFYFLVKWIPKIVADFGFPASSAATVLVWTNAGGALGGAVFGLLTQRLSVKALTIGVLPASTILVAAFGRSPADLQTLSFICAGAGFCTNAGIVGLYGDYCAGVSNARAGVWHRLHCGRGARRLSAGAAARRLHVLGRLLAARCGDDASGGLANGCDRAGAARIRWRPRCEAFGSV